MFKWEGLGGRRGDRKEAGYQQGKDGEREEEIEK